MTRSLRHTIRWIGALAATLAAASGAIGAPVAAAPSTDLFISEYVEGTGNNQAIEIYNGTASSVDLTAGEYWLELSSGTSTATTVLLSGTIDVGDVFVIANSSAGAPLRALADQLASLSFDGDDTVYLLRGFASTQPVDMIGQANVDPGSGWGTEPTDTVDSTLRRNAVITSGDVNASDPFDPALEWTGYPADTFDGLGNHSVLDRSYVSATVTVADSAACLQLSANAVDFGTLALGAENQPATPDVTVTNCSGSAGTLLASGTDATGPGASWTLDDTPQTCTGTPPLALDRYRLLVAPTGLPAVPLSTASKTIQTLAAGASNANTLRISTACPGSSGGGRTMSMQVNYTATG